MHVHSPTSIKEITMKNISVFIEGGQHTLRFRNPIVTSASHLTVNEAVVFWNFKNVTEVIGNKKIVIKSTESTGDVEIVFGDGYWDFQQIKKLLETNKLKLSMNVHNNTCSIINNTGKTVDLKKFGQLLGFPENHILQVNETVASPKLVDVNHGLRWLTVTCDLIEDSKNKDLNGNSSSIIAYLPITPGTRLNSNCYVYEKDYTLRPVKNDIVYEMVFEVNSNIPEKVDVDILMNITLQ